MWSALDNPDVWLGTEWWFSLLADLPLFLDELIDEYVAFLLDALPFFASCLSLVDPDRNGSSFLVTQFRLLHLPCSIALFYLLFKKCGSLHRLLFPFIQEFLLLQFLLCDKTHSIFICLFILGYFLSLPQNALGSFLIFCLTDSLVDPAQLMDDGGFLWLDLLEGGSAFDIGYLGNCFLFAGWLLRRFQCRIFRDDLSDCFQLFCFRVLRGYICLTHVITEIITAKIPI